jgi:hypothetical protein
VREIDARAWVAVVAALLALAWLESKPFLAYARAPLPELEWRAVGHELARVPGKKVVFFDLGYEGQMLEYQTRDNPSLELRLNKTFSWGSGGTPATVESVGRDLAQTLATTRCYFYEVSTDGAVFKSTFEPVMQREGFAPAPSPGGGLRAFCKP